MRINMPVSTDLSASTLELVALTKRYSDTVAAVDNVDLRIPANHYCCLLGPSGCGKSSTLRMIAGHETVTSGDVLLGGRNITDASAAERGTAMMFQSYALFPHLSVLDNVAFSLKMRGVSKAARHQRASALPPQGRRNLRFRWMASHQRAMATRLERTKRRRLRSRL